MHQKTSLPHDGYLFLYMTISSLRVPPMARRAYCRAFKVVVSAGLGIVVHNPIHCLLVCSLYHHIRRHLLPCILGFVESIKEKIDSDVATNMKYDVALFTSCYKSICKPKTDSTRIRGPPQIIASFRRWTLWMDANKPVDAYLPQGQAHVWNFNSHDTCPKFEC